MELELDKKINDLKNINHSAIFEKLAEFLQDKNINYIILRGFTKLPLLPDTDLDIVVESKSFNIFVDLLNKSKYFSNNSPKEIIINNKNCIYYPFFTIGKKDDNIPNGRFRLDIHNKFFFFYKNRIVLNDEISKEIFNTKEMFKKIYSVPNNSWEFILLLYRIIYDLKGKIRGKHMNRLIFLRTQIILNYKELEEILKIIKKENEETYKLFINFIKTHKLTKDGNGQNLTFIFWKKNNAIIEFKKYNKFKILEEKVINIKDLKIRYNKINDIYEVILKKHDPRVISQNPINIIVIEDNNPIYENHITQGTGTNKVVNSNIFLLKKKLRKELRFSYKDLHAADEIHESNKVFKTFNLEKYINKKIIIPIKYIRGVIWIEHNKSYKLMKIENTPHYKYILGNKKQYIDYINIVEKIHKQNIFDNLINNFDCNRCLSESPKCLILDNGTYLLYDGLHRISLLKYCGYQNILVNIIEPFQKTKYHKIKYSSIE